MSYLTQSRLAADQILMQRVTACAVVEGVENAPRWAQEQAWALSAQPGWVDAYKSAGPTNPGASETAITDEMILTAVRALAADAASTQ